jgi:hypothetical protein
VSARGCHTQISKFSSIFIASFIYLLDNLNIQSKDSKLYFELVKLGGGLPE